MPIKSNTTNVKLKVAVMVILAGGVVWGVLGQNYGTRRGIPDPASRIALTLLPFALLALGLLILARSRADVIVLLLFAVPISLVCGALFDVDELGLSHLIFPILQSMLAVAALVVVLIRRLAARWLNRRKDAARAVPNPPRPSATSAP